MAGKFILKMGNSGQFTFNLRAGNSQTILTSESYADKRGALAGIESVKKNSGNDANYERETSSRQEPYFVLKSPNGQVIGRSEMYSSTAAMENGIKSVKTNGPTAEIDDQIA